MQRFYRTAVILVLVLLPSAMTPAQVSPLKELTLDGAISMALVQNRDILNATEETTKANYQIMEATSGAMPQVSGFWDAQKTLKQQVFVISFPDSTGKLVKNRLKVGTAYTASMGATLTQPLYVGGKVGTALEIAKIYRRVSDETLVSVKQNVVLGVVQSFNSVLLARELNHIAQQSIAQAEQHLANVTALEKAGAATEYDLLRAKVNVANLKPNLVDSENAISSATLRLKEVLGMNPADPLVITGTFSDPDTSLFRLASPQTAFTNRPDLKVASGTVDLYQKNIRLARGDFLPTLTAGSTFMYSGNFDDLKYDAADWTPYWYASVSLSFPIFSGFKNYSKYQQAKVDHLQAQTDFRKQRVTTEIEVQEAIMGLRSAVKKIESQKMNVNEAERAVQLAESLFRNGKATQLEVLDAQLALDVARNNMATALFDGTIAEVTLKKSLGLIDATSKEGSN